MVFFIRGLQRRFDTFFIRFETFGGAVCNRRVTGGFDCAMGVRVNGRIRSPVPFPGPGSGAHGGVTAGLRTLQMELVTAGQSRSRPITFVYFFAQNMIMRRLTNHIRVLFCST